LQAPAYHWLPAPGLAEVLQFFSFTLPAELYPPQVELSVPAELHPPQVELS
jgi:hypothetical protein